MAPSTSELTVLPRAWRDGSGDAFEAVARAVQGEFQRMAASRLSGHGPRPGRAGQGRYRQRSLAAPDAL